MDKQLINQALLEQIKLLKAENATMKSVLFGRKGVLNALHAIDELRKKHWAGDVHDASFKLCDESRAVWHQASANAYEIVLEKLDSRSYARLCAQERQRQAALVDEDAANEENAERAESPGM